jgi:hypothetical protein
MKTLIDQLEQPILWNFAQRIISLVPSQTELLYDLGQEAKIGITKFCVHPYHFRSTKKLLAVPKKYITKNPFA